MSDKSEASVRAREGWVRRLRFSGFSAIMLGVLVIGVLIIAPNLRLYVEQRQQIANYRSLVQQERDDVTSLAAERERWNDPIYVETQARDRLYFVNPGESSYMVKNDLDPALSGAEPEPVSEKVRENRTDWSRGLLGSFLGAGLGESALDTAADH